jgi:hypothetical protein
MAAGEDEAELVVLKGLVIQSLRIEIGLPGFLGDGSQQGLVTPATADNVDSLEPTGRDKPGSRIPGQAFPRPLFQGRAKGLLKRVFRQVEVAEQADQGSQYPPRLCAVQLRHLLVYRFVQPHPSSVRFNGTAGGQSPAN